MRDITLFTHPLTTFPNDRPVQNIFAFVCLMCAVVSSKRGGRASQYLRECYEFVADVVGARLHTADPLPPDFDWTPLAAVECANTMLEYDDD